MRRTAAQRLTACRRAGMTLLVAVSVGMAAAACGRHHVEDEPEVDPNEPTPLTVTNNNWLDVVIYVYHDGETSRVAIVTAATSANYFLPAWMLGHSRSIRLFAHAVGSNSSISTDLIHIQPGQFIEWHLESDLARSSVAVY